MSHDHKHDQASSHHHPHEHDHTHSHEHSHEHSPGHDHPHPHGHAHSHEQEHTHVHESTGEGSREDAQEMSLEDKLAVLLSHWVDHNDSHKNNFLSWAKKAEDAGQNEIAACLEQGRPLEPGVDIKRVFRKYPQLQRQAATAAAKITAGGNHSAGFKG